ncbi:MAG: hypothetical protein JJU15_05350 [Pararhodobacter sp.]|nr:hypothetical protein [Pararhodobacter sp.]
MTLPRGPMFVERASYRRRRLMDGARILPMAGFALCMLPVLWTDAAGANVAAEAVYLFVLWCGLIVVAAVLARPLRSGLQRDAPLDAVTGATPPAQEPTGATPQERGTQWPEERPAEPPR